MDNLVYLGASSGAILFVGALGMAHRATQLRDDLIKANRKIEEIQQELKLVQNSLVQVRSIDLDFSVIENQIEDSEQRVFSHIQQEIGGLASAIKNLESRVESLEEDIENLELKNTPDENVDEDE